MSLDRFYSGPRDEYVELIDFKDTTADYGLYVFEDQISFYGSGNEYLGGTLTANTFFDILLTRSASNEIKIYLDGSSTPIISFMDTAGDAVPTLVGGMSRFRLFHDDPKGQPNNDEWSTGSVDEIRLWNLALTPAEAGGDGGAGGDANSTGANTTATGDDGGNGVASATGSGSTATNGSPGSPG